MERLLFFAPSLIEPIHSNHCALHLGTRPIFAEIEGKRAVPLLDIACHGGSSDS